MWPRDGSRLFGRIEDHVGDDGQADASTPVLSEYYGKDAGRRDKILEEQPIKHLGQPEEIAEIAVLLASDRGSYITGQTMVVDGGRLLP